MFEVSVTALPAAVDKPRGREVAYQVSHLSWHSTIVSAERGIVNPECVFFVIVWRRGRMVRATHPSPMGSGRSVGGVSDPRLLLLKDAYDARVAVKLEHDAVRDASVVLVLQ